MIKYPLYVTFDTNIIDENQYDFSESGTLALLEKYVAQGKIKVVLSNIVCDEVKRHLSNRAKEITSLLNNALKDIRKTTSKSFISSIGYRDRIEKQDPKMAQTKAVECFENFLNSLTPEILDTKNVDTEKIFSDYFSYKPPFENNDKKRKEFPDAFIAEQINLRFGTSEIVAIVSKDKGFKNACGNSESHLFFDSLGDLFDKINRQDDHYELATTLVSVTYKSEIYRNIKDLLSDADNISITGQTVDNDGIIDGNEYDETYVENVSGISYKLHTVEQISDDKIIVILNAKAEITVYCSYDDYYNAAWDSEEKKYIFLDTIELREKHNARFPVRVTIDNISDDITVQTSMVLLGPTTRISQDNLTYEKYLQDIEDQDRESCGLTSLRKYDSFIEENFADSKMKQDICEQFERINDISSKYEDASGIYDDLLEAISNDTNTIITKLIPLAKDIEDFPDNDDSEELTHDFIESVKDWINNKFDEMSNMAEKNRLPDYVSLGDDIEITDGSDETYLLSIEGLENLSPEAGQEELIQITLYGGDEDVMGYIKVTEGYVNFDEDGGIADALDDDIVYSYDEILDSLKCMAEKFEKKAEDALSLAETLGEVVYTT